MKKSLLMIMACGVAVTAFSQGAYKKLPIAIMDGNSSNKVVTTPMTQKNGQNSTQTDSCKTLGTAGNAYGTFTRPGRSQLYYDPNVNMMIMIHRSNPSVDGSATTGEIFYDKSTDGGLTWTNQIGSIFVAGTELARYPQGWIYNPAANTNPNNAYVAHHGASTNGTNWIAYTHSTTPVSSVNVTQGVTLFTTQDQGLIPYGMDVTQNGTVWITDIYNDGPSAYDYQDSIILRKGTWNSSTNTYDYTNKMIYAPSSLDANGYHNMGHVAAAFNGAGTIGYLVALGHFEQAFTLFPDSSMYYRVWKSTDGGNTWAFKKDICFNNLDSLFGNLGSTQYTTGFDFDLIVDANDNLHISAIGSPQATTGGWSVPSNSVKIAMDVYTTNGGNTWKAKKLGQTQTFRGYFGPSNPPNFGEDNRPQVSTNWDRNRIFFTWFDTDTLTFGNNGNIYPDAHCVALNITTGLWSAEMNFTTGSPCADGNATFGCVPQYVIGNTVSYEVPLAAMILTTGNDMNPVDFRYYTGNVITDLDMTNIGGSVYLCLTSSVDDINSLFTISDVYPNPSNGLTSFNITLTKSSEVSVNVMNAVGQNVMDVMNSDLNAGTHSVKIDVSKLSAGVYFYTVNAGGFRVTKKMIVE
jgi:hypothetical protein